MSPKQHILFLTLTIPPVNYHGGRRIYYLAKELVKMGYRTTILCRQWVGTEYWNIHLATGNEIQVFDKPLTKKYLQENFLMINGMRSLLMHFLRKRYYPPLKLVDRKTAKEMLFQSDALLFFCFFGKKKICSSKIFEYLALQKPILCVVSDQDVVEELLIRTGVGTFANDVEAIEQVLLNWIEQKKRIGSIPFHPNLEEVQKYTYEFKAKELADFLNSFK